MSNLINDLTSKPQRETAGSDSASRFDYQKDWAFCEMMKKHIGGQDYLVAFEYHDDVLFLAPSDCPETAEFCQVKTSSSADARKLSTLTARPKGRASILGKMFANFEGICSSQDVRLVLVSNTAFEFSQNQVCADELDEKFRKKLADKLKTEISDFDESQLKRLHFLVTGVSLDAMKSFLEGEAMELFSQKFGEDHGLNVRTWVRLLKGEIARRNNYPSDKVKDAADLIDKKCINRPLVEETLSVISAKTRQFLDVPALSSYLTAVGWEAHDVMRLQKQIPQANTDFYDPLNKEVKKMAECIRGNVFDTSGNPIKFEKFLQRTCEKLYNNDKIPGIYRQKPYLHALGAIVYYEEI